MRETLKEIEIEQVIKDNVTSMVTVDKEIQKALQHVMNGGCFVRPTVLSVITRSNVYKYVQVELKE